MDEQAARRCASELLRRIGIDDPIEHLRDRTSGRSGASTFEVATPARTYILKADAPERPLRAWRDSVRIQRLAASAGVAPEALAEDVTSRAVLSAHIDDVSLVRAASDPTRTGEVLIALATTLAALHGLDAPPDLAAPSPFELVGLAMEATTARYPLPRFAQDVWHDFEGRYTEPGGDRLCHHDLNPTNILFDGGRVWFVDWQTASRGDGSVDLATVINMLLLDAEHRDLFVGAYRTQRGLPREWETGLLDARRIAYVAYGMTFLSLVQVPASDIPRDALPSLAQCYARLGSGTLDLSTDEGRWQIAAANFAGYWETTAG